MSVLVVGAYNAKKGEEYQAVRTKGNAFRIMENVRFSINRTPMVKLPLDEDILTHPEFTYSPEKDTVILLTKVVPLNLSTIHEGNSTATYSLSSGVESGVICSAIVTADTASGFITCASLIKVTTGADVNITIKSYDDGVLYATSTHTARKQDVSIVVQYHQIATPIVKDSVMTFTITADVACTVEGTVKESFIQIEQKNI